MYTSLYPNPQEYEGSGEALHSRVITSPLPFISMFSPAYLQLSHVLRALVDIPGDELAKLPQIFQQLSCRTGEFFIRAGEVPQQIGFVVSGIFRLYYVNVAGTEFTKSFCPENHFVTAYSALILKQPAQFFY
ncbi:Crp/Fnr family transcriptional regulator [Nostoc piscinale]|uniref:Crp/Fnr family transcriptional regulator n=1 Tax=Nostoc piscinale TaxID=224012 RepID=UPI001F1E5521|nr:hypothetical protein [Nostoc piscinale]